MINVKYLLGSDELCLPHTGLRVAEFGYLLRGFAPEYELHMNELYEKEHGKKRTRKL
jgi:hypothetical protein